MQRLLSAVMALAVVQATAASALTLASDAAAHETARAKDERQAEEREPPTPATTLLWADTGLGWHRVGLTTLQVDRTAGGDALTGDLVPSVLSGPSVQLGFGIRWLVLTFGARFGASFFDDPSPGRSDGSSQLYSADAEIGFRIPAGRLEPYFIFAGGYSRFGGLDDAIQGVGRGLDIDGANLRLGFGLDYFIDRHVSIGARIAGEALFLSRPGIPLRQLATPESVNTLGEAKARLLEGEGTSAGTAFAVTVGPGFHF
jgi:hypothetical protein